MPPEMPASNAASWLRATALVAATFTYFLLFAQFAFLELARAALGPDTDLRGVLSVQGVVGLAGGILAGRRYSARQAGRWLGGGFIFCLIAAATAPLARSDASLALVAAGTGFGLGLATVTLAASLRALAGGRRLGLACGLGTGIAYAIGSLPPVFSAEPSTQAAIAAAAAALGALLSWRLGDAPRSVPAARPDRAGALTLLVALFALVAFDSAAFYIVQHTPRLEAGAWVPAVAAGQVTLVHLALGVLAGLALDRAGRPVVLGAAAALLSIACLGLDAPRPWLALVYAAGVSLYSTALVEWPARSARPTTAAWVFGVCGWVGSGVGLGIAQGRELVPLWLIVAAALLALGPLVVWRRSAVLACALLLALAATPDAAAESDELVAAGREVYVAEGCIHCHSQYVRPGTGDAARWGPVRPLATLLEAQPPLPGNRRQGPDLQNVGNRRWPEWNRLHLVSPRAVTPGSSMPSYAYLFADGDQRGEALLAYLASLGADTFADHQAAVEAWRPGPAPSVAPRDGAGLFAQYCAGCHGGGGRGDGVLASRLARRPANLRAERWQWLGPQPDPAAERLALARVIKFGLPGTAMAGREYLGDDAVLALASFVQSLHAAPAP